MGYENKDLYVVCDNIKQEIIIFTTKIDACRYVGINTITLSRSIKNRKLYKTDKFIIGMSNGINKNYNRVKIGKRINFNKG